MKSTGQIEEIMFSLYISNVSFEHNDVYPPSNIFFGGFDLQRYSSDSEFTYISLVNDAYTWLVPLETAWFDGNLLHPFPELVRFTTATLLMLVPEAYFKPFVEKMVSFHGCGQFPNRFMDCPCDAQVQYEHNLTLVMGGVRVEVPMAAYFYQEESTCYLLITNTTEDVLVLGSLFLSQYYTLFDYDHHQVGISRALPSARLPHSSASGLQWWGWLMVVVLLICTVVTVFFLFKILKRRRKKRIEVRNEQVLIPMGSNEEAM